MATLKFILKQPYKEGQTKRTPGTKNLKGKGKTLNPNETRIYAVLIVDRNNIVKIKTEHVIYPKEWDFARQGKREILTGSIEFNKRLRKLKDELLALYDKTIKETPDMPFSQVAEILKATGKRIENPFIEIRKSFFDYFDEFLVSLEGEVTAGTIKKFNTLKISLQDFISKNKKYERLTFTQVDHAFKNTYVKYLNNLTPRGRMKRRPEGQQTGLLLDTQRKYIESLKTFLRWADIRKYNPSKTYEEFENTTTANRKRRKQGQDIVTLTISELKKLYEHDFSSHPTFERVRDLFCFAAYTGQRWSDIERFEKSQLNVDIWSFRAFKTKKDTEIDLTGYAAPALDILRKYDYKLPVISLQKFNDYLKEAAKEAGIDKQVKVIRYVGTREIEMRKPKYEFLSSHTARKTCVSLLLNVYNIPVTHVLEITGHSEIKTLQKYINKDRQARREAMSKTIPVTAPMTVIKGQAV